MTETTIDIQGLSKVYRVGQAEERHDTVSGAAMAWLKAPLRNFRKLHKLSHFEDRDHAEDVVWALRDISLQVARGEVVGIIGHNGAGKSTLLKILSRITLPTEGRAVLRGRVGSLLEVGTGFHPDLTGRENTYLNGAILGMKRAEIERKFDEIVDFAGVSAFIETPVKRYSSGMYLRLAFAVAAHLDPEILVVDEVLAVGDHAFQQQCLGKMGAIAKTGRTVLFVSHNLSAVERLCRSAVVLDNGRIAFQGSSNAAIEHYLRRSKASKPLLETANHRRGRGRLRFSRIAAEADGEETLHLTSGDPARLVLSYRIEGPDLPDIRVRVGWTNLLGETLFVCVNDFCGCPITTLRGPTGTIQIDIPELPLNAGTYRLQAWLKSERELEDLVEDAGELTVAGGDFYGTGASIPADCGPLLLHHRFSLRDAAP